MKSALLLLAIFAAVYAEDAAETVRPKRGVLHDDLAAPAGGFEGFESHGDAATFGGAIGFHEGLYSGEQLIGGQEDFAGPEPALAHAGPDYGGIPNYGGFPAEPFYGGIPAGPNYGGFPAGHNYGGIPVGPIHGPGPIYGGSPAAPIFGGIVKGRELVVAPAPTVIKVPVPQPVPVPHPVPHDVPVPQPVPVPHPIPIPHPVPVPQPFPVVKKVVVPVIRTIPVPVHIKVPVPVRGFGGPFIKGPILPGPGPFHGPIIPVHGPFHDHIGPYGHGPGPILIIKKYKSGW